jgi:hypothetical protein
MTIWSGMVLLGVALVLVGAMVLVGAVVPGVVVLVLLV